MLCFLVCRKIIECVTALCNQIVTICGGMLCAEPGHNLALPKGCSWLSV